MDSLVTQLGVGGIFAVLVLRMVLDFLDKQKRNGSKKSGEMDPEYWKAAFRGVVMDAVGPLAERSREEMREIKLLLGKVLERINDIERK